MQHQEQHERDTRAEGHPKQEFIPAIAKRLPQARPSPAARSARRATSPPVPPVDVARGQLKPALYRRQRRAVEAKRGGVSRYT